jgi:hypothetical protein
MFDVGERKNIAVPHQPSKAPANINEHGNNANSDDLKETDFHNSHLFPKVLRNSYGSFGGVEVESGQGDRAEG